MPRGLELVNGKPLSDPPGNELDPKNVTYPITYESLGGKPGKGSTPLLRRGFRFTPEEYRDPLGSAPSRRTPLARPQAGEFFGTTCGRRRS
eukprot:3549494-Pyramimonas_sp.AAC.1